MKGFIYLVETFFNSIFNSLNLPITMDGTVFIIFIILALGLYFSLKAH